MQQTALLQQRIAEAISGISIPPAPANLYDPIGYMLQIGGKRIRPLLTLLSAQLFGVSAIEEALPAALAVELFHNFSLVHDDIMDAAPLRRGKPTVHQQWDSSIAILSGDRLLVMAYQELAKCPGQHLPRLLNTFNTMSTGVCEGQQLDMDFEQRAAVSLDEYIQMITLKTAVLLGAALEMGAIIGGAAEADARLIYTFGVHVGIAFQLQDDLLDLYGNPEQVGKQPGGDILANKKTYLLVKALEVASPATQAQLTHLFTAPHPSPQAKITAITDIYNQLGVQQLAENDKQAYVDTAFGALDRIDVAEDRKQQLRILAQNLLHREA